MYAVIRIERSQQDNTGDPGVDFETDYEVLLFPSDKEATDFLAAIPFSKNVKWHLLDPDESHILIDNRRDEDMAPKHS